MKESESKEPSKTAGAARQGGNTNTEIIGSAVSTAAGEPVALLQRMLDNDFGKGDWPTVGEVERAINKARLAAPTQAKPVDLSGLVRYTGKDIANIYSFETEEFFEAADVERLFAAPTQAKPVASAFYWSVTGSSGWDFKWLGSKPEHATRVDLFAAPTQVSAPQADELSISRQKLNMAKIDVLMDGARARSEEFRDGVTFGANSLHMKILDLAGAPQASAAQEVRAVPEGMQTDLEQIAQSWDGCMVDAVGETMDVGATLRLQFKQLSTSTSTSTAPAAMDEKGGAA